MAIKLVSALSTAQYIQFQNASGTSTGKIEANGDDLIITNSVGNVLFGDLDSNVYIGDGVNNVDIIFEQSGAIRSENGSNATITLGGSGTTLNVYNPNIANGASLTSTLSIGTGGVIDFLPDTGAIINLDGQTILKRNTFNGGITLGHDDAVIIAGGDTYSVMESNINLGTETVFIGAEGGLEVYAFPNNDTSWSNRKIFTFSNNSNFYLDGSIYPSSQTTNYVDSTRIANWQTAYGWGNHGSQGYLTSVNNNSWSGADLSVANGGTGASSASAARTNLGLGTAATSAATDFVSATGDDTMTGTLTLAKESQHVSQGSISASNAHLDLYNTWQSDTDQKGSIITFTDNYYGSGTYNKTLRAAIKGGTDTTGNTADGYLEFYTDSAGANSPNIVLRLDKNRNASFYGNVTASGNVTGANLNISNWNTAYGWGNHASAGYLTSFDITTQTDSKYLRSDTNDTFSGILTGSAAGENLKIGGIRGTAKGSQAGQYIHLYERVHVGGPSGWGASTHGAPSYGLSTWGSVDFGMNGTGVIQLDGTTIVNASRQLVNVTNTNWDAAYEWGNHALAGYLTAHPNITAASSVNNSGRSYIQDITVDSNGHVTGITSATETVVNTDTVTSVGVSGSEVSGTVTLAGGDATTVSQSGNTITIRSTNTEYTVGDGGLTQKNFTSTLKTKLDGIEASADVTDATNVSAAGALMRSGGTMTGDLRVTNGDNNGIRFHSGGANITSVVSGDVVIQRLTAGLRFGSSSSWDYNEWAGINFDSTNEILYIGGPAASQFSSNSNPPTIDVNFVGVDEVQLGGNALATQEYVNTAVSNVVASAPAALDTLNELAAALGDDANFSTTMSTALGNRLRVDTASQGLTSTQKSNARTNLGLGTLATLNSVNAATITDNSVGAAELNVTGNGSSGQVLTSDGDGTMSWTNKTTNTDTVTSVGVSGSEVTGTVTLTAGNNVTLTQTGNTIEIRANDSDTTYSAGTGLTLSGTTFSVTAGTYAAASHTHAAGDVTSGTFATARIPNLSASKITAGTLGNDRISEWLPSKHPYQTYGSSGVYMPMVKGGLLTGGSSSVTGRLRIKVPHYKANIMQSFVVDVYEYDTDRMQSYIVSGYSYGDANASWYNTSAIALQDSDNRNLTVRFGKDTTNGFQCVSIGETNTTWTYPNIVVRDYMAGHDASTAEVLNDWTVEFVTTDTAAYDASHSNNSPIIQSTRISGQVSVANGGTGSNTAAGARTNLGLGSLATLSTVDAATITNNSVGAAELNVSGNGTSGQVLTSDGDGTFSWTAKTTNTDTITSVGVTGSETSGVITLTGAGATTITQSGGAIEIRSTDTNTTYSVGDGGLTEKNFTSTLKTKLDGIEAGATADQTPAQILTAIKTVDGSTSGLDADLLDGVHAASFLRADANTTVGANLLVNQTASSNASIVYTYPGGTYVPKPNGASYATSTNTHTGAIGIKLPTASWNTSDMISFNVDIYDYAGSSAGESVSLYVYGYQYGTGNWTNCGAVVLSDRTDRDYTVRFGNDGTRHIVYIGETTSPWNYLQITVRDFQAGYSAESSTRYDNGWEIAVNQTSFSNVQQTSSANYPVAKQLKTARNIALSGAVTGNANFDGSGNITIATTATSDPTLTLAGDASGSATFTNLGNATLTVTVANDSHTHDGRYYTESEIDTKLANVSNWNTAYTDRNKWDGGSTGLNAATGRTSLGLGTLATLNTVNAATITDNSVGAAELNVTGNGSSGQVLTSDGDGTMSWTNKTTNTDTITSVGVTGSETSGVITLTGAGATTITQSGGAIEIRSTNTEYTVGDGGLTQNNFTNALKTKLDGIAAGATNVTNNNQLTNGAGYITGVSFANVSSKPAFVTNSNLSSRTTTTPDTAGDGSGASFHYLSSSATNKPSGTDHSLLTMAYSNDWQTQIAQDWRNKGRMYLRGQENTTWSEWIRVHTTDDFSTTDVANGATAYTWGNHASAGYLTAHPSITEAADVNNSNGTVIQDLTFDDNGHVTGTGSVNLDGRYYTETEIDNELNTLSAALRANTNITGGGTITVNSSGYIKNSARFIVIANGRGTHFATSGYFDINIPTSGTVTGVGGSSNKTATSNGVPLDTWEALYYILPVGSGNASVAANFRVARYTADVVIPETWVLIAVRNGDSGQKVWVINKYGLELGQSVDTTVYDARYAQYAASAGSVAYANVTGTPTLGTAAAAATTDFASADHGHTAATQSDAGFMSSADKTKLDGIAASANNYSLPAGSSTVRGGFKIGYTENGKNYPVEVSSEKMFVNVPWVNTEYSNATTSASGLMSSTDKTKLNGIATGADLYIGWNFVDTNNAATRIDTQEYFKIAGATISGTGTVQDPYLVNTPDTNTTYTADGNYGMTLNGTAFRLEDDRRRNSTTADIYTGNTHDYTFYDADIGIRWYTAGAEEMRLEDDGDLHVDGDVVAFSATVSDARLKDDVETIENATEKVKQLRGVEYTWNKGGREGQREIGVIAQEVEKVVPEIVHEKKLPFIGDETYKTVDYEKLVALLIESNKELAARVETLEAKLDGITK